MNELPSPKISIVLPVFNGERYLADAIRSCLAQSERGLELIVVDDASTDGTPDILHRLAAEDGRIRRHRNAANLRLPASLNEGFRHARGRYWTWTSDDNCWAPTALARLSGILDATPDCQIAYADYTTIDAEGAVLERQTAGDVRRLGHSNVIGPCFLYRAAVHTALGGFDETAFLAEDYDFWLRAASRFRFVHVAEDLYRYRTHPASLGVSRSAEVQAAVERVLTRHVRDLPRPMRADAFSRLFALSRARSDRPAMVRAALGWAIAAPLAFVRSVPSQILRLRP